MAVRAERRDSSGSDDSEGGEVVGAYGYNNIAGVGVSHPCNIVFTCKTPLWYNPGPCAGGSFFGLRPGNARPFPKDDPDWGTPGVGLRGQFERELTGEAMAREFAAAPKPGCYGSPVPSATAEHLKQSTWCNEVNTRLLHPAGYECAVRFWVTTSRESRETEEHVCIDIKRYQQLQEGGDAPVGVCVQR